MRVSGTTGRVPNSTYSICRQDYRKKSVRSGLESCVSDLSQRALKKECVLGIDSGSCATEMNDKDDRLRASLQSHTDNFYVPISNLRITSNVHERAVGSLRSLS